MSCEIQYYYLIKLCKFATCMWERGVKVRHGLRGYTDADISWENQLQQQRRLCRQILLPRPRRLRPRDPWAMQLKLQQMGEGAGESPAP